jgi:hypothetical protein
VLCGMNSTTLTACHNGNSMPKMNVPAILYSVTSGGTSSWVPKAAIDGSSMLFVAQALPLSC